MLAGVGSFTPPCFLKWDSDDAGGGLKFPCMFETNRHAQTTLLSWLYVGMDGEKPKTETAPNSKVRPTLWQNQTKPPVLQVIYLPASKSTSHAGNLGSSLRRSIWTICRTGSSLLILVNVASFIASTSLPAFLKYKRLWLCLCRISHSRNVQALSWCSFSIVGGL